MPESKKNKQNIKLITHNLQFTCQRKFNKCVAESIPPDSYFIFLYPKSIKFDTSNRAVIENTFDSDQG